MKTPDKCPKCGYSHPQPLTNEKDRFYCPKCKHVWIKGREQESLAESGSTEFNGIMPAKQLVEMVAKNAELGAAAKSAFVAQFTGTLFEQWYEGFKAGLLADIVHKRDLYDDGKDKHEHGTKDREHSTGNRQAGEQDDKDSSGVEQVRRTPKAFDRVKERVGGVTIIRPKNLQPTENQYVKIAEKVESFGKEKIDELYFDGLHLEVKFKM